MNKHNAKEFLPLVQALADGETIQVKTDEDPVIWLNIDCPAFDKTPEDYRIKPRTININGIEVPEPMREPPECDSRYYFPSFSSSESIGWSYWNRASKDYYLLASGLCHASRDAAKEHAKALISLTKRDK